MQPPTHMQHLGRLWCRPTLSIFMDLSTLVRRKRRTTVTTCNTNNNMWKHSTAGCLSPPPPVNPVISAKDPRRRPDCQPHSNDCTSCNITATWYPQRIHTLVCVKHWLQVASCTYYFTWLHVPHVPTTSPGSCQVDEQRRYHGWKGTGAAPGPIPVHHLKAQTQFRGTPYLQGIYLMSDYQRRHHVDQRHCRHQ